MIVPAAPWRHGHEPVPARAPGPGAARRGPGRRGAAARAPAGARAARRARPPRPRARRPREVASRGGATCGAHPWLARPCSPARSRCGTRARRTSAGSARSGTPRSSGPTRPPTPSRATPPLSPYRPTPAFARTAEDSVYVARDRRGEGLGRRVLDELLRRAAAAGHHSVLARVTAPNTASLRLHARAGFRTVGVERETAFKLGRWLDVVVLQRRSEEH